MRGNTHTHTHTHYNSHATSTSQMRALHNSSDNNIVYETRQNIHTCRNRHGRIKPHKPEQNKRALRGRSRCTLCRHSTRLRSRNPHLLALSAAPHCAECSHVATMRRSGRQRHTLAPTTPPRKTKRARVGGQGLFNGSAERIEQKTARRSVSTGAGMRKHTRNILQNSSIGRGAAIVHRRQSAR